MIPLSVEKRISLGPQFSEDLLPDPRCSRPIPTCMFLLAQKKYVSFSVTYAHPIHRPTYTFISKNTRRTGNRSMKHCICRPEKSASGNDLKLRKNPEGNSPGMIPASVETRISLGPQFPEDLLPDPDPHVFCALSTSSQPEKSRMAPFSCIRTLHPSRKTVLFYGEDEDGAERLSAENQREKT